MKMLCLLLALLLPVQSGGPEFNYEAWIEDPTGEANDEFRTQDVEDQAAALLGTLQSALADYDNTIRPDLESEEFAIQFKIDVYTMAIQGPPTHPNYADIDYFLNLAQQSKNALTLCIDFTAYYADLLEYHVTRAEGFFENGEFIACVNECQGIFEVGVGWTYEGGFHDLDSLNVFVAACETHIQDAKDHLYDVELIIYDQPEEPEPDPDQVKGGPVDALKDAIVRHLRGEFSPMFRKSLRLELERFAKVVPDIPNAVAPEWEAAIAALVNEGKLEAVERDRVVLVRHVDDEPEPSGQGLLF